MLRTVAVESSDRRTVPSLGQRDGTLARGQEDGGGGSGGAGGGTVRRGIREGRSFAGMIDVCATVTVAIVAKGDGGGGAAVSGDPSEVHRLPR